MQNHLLEQILPHVDKCLEQGKVVIIALEGGSASGKSTLGAQLAEKYSAVLLHMDDFFLQPHQRTPERFQQPGGNVDWERFLEEVLLPLRAGKPFSYRPFDCSCMDFAPAVQVRPGRMAVVEGAYSMHPALREYYDLAVFLDVDEKTQSDRILRRNGEKWHARFVNEWIPLENVYFAAAHVKEKCHLVLPVNDEGDV